MGSRTIVNFADPKHSEEIRPSIGGVALAGTIVVPGDSQKRLTLPEQAGAGSGGHPPVLMWNGLSSVW
jgi:hypothetical protein